MLKSCPKFIVSLFVLASFFLLSTSIVYATRTITSTTLNGSSSVTVAPSASITAVVNVTTIADGSGATWGSTQWTVNGVNTCVDHTNHTTAGSYTETFSITAPASVGVYNVTFTAYVTNSCGTGPATYTLTNGITVEVASTPTSTTAPGQPTATPTTASSSSSSTATTVPPPTPSVSFLNAVSLTNQKSITFNVTASVSEGSISSLEYVIDDGSSWTSLIASDGNFNSKEETSNFNLELSEGKHSIKIRTKSQAGQSAEASHFITIITTPPSVVIDEIEPNPTNNTRPLLTGSATSKLGIVTKVEVSIDAGLTYLPASFSNSKFAITTGELDDGNYEVLSRAFDNAGNIGISQPQTLIVDTIPPIIGGGFQSMGPQILTPDNNGIVSLVAGAQTIIALSMKGGVTKAMIKSGNNSFPLVKLANTNIWVAKLKFDESGEKKLTIEAIDGAQNKTERNYNTVLVHKFGKIIDKNTQQAIESANVTLFYFETISQQWVPWEAPSYGQNNPQTSNSTGSYSYMVPPGRYYLEIKAKGFNTSQSEIIEVTQTTILNYPLTIRSRPKIEISLPFFGKIFFSLASFFPPDSFTININSPVSDENSLPQNKSVTDLSEVSFLNLENKEVTLNNYKGKNILLTFISSWSSLSQEQAPFLSRAATKITDDQALLVVMLQESVATSQSFMKRGNYNFPLIADKDGLSANAFMVTLLPYHVTIDKEGKIFSSHTGVLNEKQLLELLNSFP